MVLNKRILVIFVLAILFAIVGISIYWYSQFSKHPGLESILVGDNTVYVYVADTEASRELGLSGRQGLAADEGMLFVFPVEGKFPFWMKDMKFSIDILWIANDGTVMHIEKNVSPDTFPKTFAPASGLARYVLEVRAGYSEAHGIDLGTLIEL